MAAAHARPPARRSRATAAHNATVARAASRLALDSALRIAVAALMAFGTQYLIDAYANRDARGAEQSVLLLGPASASAVWLILLEVVDMDIAAAAAAGAARAIIRRYAAATILLVVLCMGAAAYVGESVRRPDACAPLATLAAVAAVTGRALVALRVEQELERIRNTRRRGSHASHATPSSSTLALPELAE